MPTRIHPNSTQDTFFEFFFAITIWLLATFSKIYQFKKASARSRTEIWLFHIYLYLRCSMRDIAKYIKLSSSSGIRTGLTLRNELKLSETGNIAVLQPRNIINGELQNQPLYVDVPENSISQHFLCENDILIANKGEKFGTFLYKNEFKICVASSSFFVIKVDPGKFIPEFLIWYLEQHQTKNYFLRNSATTTIHSLSKTVLADLLIPMPSLTNQKAIVALIDLIKTENLLLKQLIKKSEEFRDSFVWEKINT